MNEIFIHFLSIIPTKGSLATKRKKPGRPIKKVIRSWLILPIMVNATTRVSSLFFKNNILPANSPTLFGVNELTATPPITAEKALKKDNCSIFLIKNFHLTDSIPQLIKISIRANNRSHQFDFRDCFNKSLYAEKSNPKSRLYKNTPHKTAMAILISQ